MSDQQTKDMSTLMEVAKLLGQIGTAGAAMYVGAGAARETYDALKAKCREMMDKLDKAQRQLDDIDPRELDAEMRSDSEPLDLKSLTIMSITSEEMAEGVLGEVERQLAMSDHMSLEPAIPLLEEVADKYPDLMYRANGLIYRIHTEDYGKGAPVLDAKSYGAHHTYR